MRVTDEVFEARTLRMEKKEQALMAEKSKMEGWLKAEAMKKKDLFEKIKANYPTAFADFQRLKKIKDQYISQDIEDKLFWLQVEMMGHKEWDYGRVNGAGPYDGMTDYDKNEEAIIIEVAGKYYESIEECLWRKESAEIDEQELISRIESAGVDTFERQDYLYRDTTYLLNGYSRLWDQIYGTQEHLIEILSEDIPDELQ